MDRRSRVVAILAACVITLTFSDRRLRLRDERPQRLEPHRVDGDLWRRHAVPHRHRDRRLVVLPLARRADEGDGDLGQHVHGLGAARQPPARTASTTPATTRCSTAAPGSASSCAAAPQAGQGSMSPLRRKGAAMSACDSRSSLTAGAVAGAAARRGRRQRGAQLAATTRRAPPPSPRRPRTDWEGATYPRGAGPRASPSERAAGVPLPAGGTFNGVRWELGGGHRRRERDRRRARLQRRLPVAAGVARRPRRGDRAGGARAGAGVAGVPGHGVRRVRRHGRRGGGAGGGETATGMLATATPRTRGRSPTPSRIGLTPSTLSALVTSEARSRLIGDASRRAWSKVLAGWRDLHPPRRSPQAAAAGDAPDRR